MRAKFLSVLTVFILSVVINTGLSQAKVAKLQQFNNFSASFEVPVGKTWIIHQIFSSFVSDVSTDSNGITTSTPIRIFIKTLNGDIKTDYAGNRFGPQVYQSNNTSAVVSYPIVFPEKTKFSLIIIKGDPGNCATFDGTAYMSFFEVTNN